MILEKYSDEIEDAIKKLNSISNFEFNSVNIYGSAAHEELFSENTSDIDIIVMCKEFANFNKNDILKQLQLMNIDFKEKRPTIIKDNLCERIEFYIAYKRINIDITICPCLIPTRESLEKDAWYDGFEALMGGVYINSKSIYGQIPDYDIFLNNYFPFYDEELRIKRLDILSNRLISYNDRIAQYIKCNSAEMIDHILKSRKHFIKFLYIYNRKYFLTPEKHTYYQLTNILNLPEEEKRIICFMNGDFQEASNRYIDYTNQYLENYKKSKTKSKRL